jgi:undecaprenyl-diphosphatase
MPLFSPTVTSWNDRDVQDLIATLGDLPPLAVYAVTAALVFAETGLLIGLVLPGEVTLIFVGFLVYAGTLEPVPTVILMTLAAVAGDGVGYAEGRRFGPGLRASRFGRWVGDRRWRRAEASMEQHGGRAVCLARFVAFARTLTPRLAGMSAMTYRRFLAWDVLGVVLQVVGSVALGYVAGRSYARVAEAFGRATGALLLLTLVIVALVVFGRYLGAHPDPVTAFGDRLGQWRPLRWLDRTYDAAFVWLTQRVGVTGAVVVNILLGIGVLLAFGVSLTWAIDRLVSNSGFPLVDPLIADWIATQRAAGVTDAAMTTLSILRGSYLVIAAGLVGLLLNPRPASLRADLLGVVGTVGAFIPLMILALATDWARPPSAGLFPNQVTLVTASLGLLAWLVSRRLPWGGAVAVWTVAVSVMVVVSAARLYVGWNWPSEIVASMLLGGLWVVVFVVAWRTRDRVRPDVENAVGVG